MKTWIPSFLLFLLLCPFLAEASAADTSEKTLSHYLQLRLQDAKWEVYSKLITWPDEPSWDCKWVAEKYELGKMKRTGKSRTIIPVTVKRLGLYCVDFSFSPDPKEVTINYELIKSPSGWKIDEPIPDYPDIGADTLKKLLAAAAESPKEPPERKAKIAETLQKLQMR